MWLRYFDPHQALETVLNHVEALPGARHERHTMRCYLYSLAAFVEALGGHVVHQGGEQYMWDFAYMRMPTADELARYIADRKRAGISSKTIMRDLAPVRRFLRALENQPVHMEDARDFLFVMEAQRQFRIAIGVENPKPDTTSHRPALEQHGTRLTLGQVNKLFQSFEGQLHTLIARRDLALFYLAITTGLRAAELARITLNAIQPGEDCYELRVRGKRNNIDPVGMDSTAYGLLMNFVEAWNHRLATDPFYGDPSPDDPRRITGDTPVFQPIRYGDHIPYVGLNGYDPARGIDPSAILKIVAKRAESALDVRIGVHDLRRTMAFLMRSKGFEWDQIRDQLRHASIATTEKYVGREHNLAAALLGRRVRFTLPADNDLTPVVGEGLKPSRPEEGRVGGSQ